MLKYSLLLVLQVGVLISASILHNLPTEDLNEKWIEYKLKYNKIYEGVTEITRRMIWEGKLKDIEKHNKQYKLGVYSYYLGINQFTDKTDPEFQYEYLKYKFNFRSNRTNIFKSKKSMDRKYLPREVDWTKEGYVTPVLSQYDCGSCYAIGSIGALEGQYFKKYKKLQRLSVQQIVDCSYSFGNYGCNGGFTSSVYDYIKKFGSEIEEEYPYEDREDNCLYQSKYVVTKLKSYNYVDFGDEYALAEAVAEIGPITVAINAADSFNDYKGGIYDNKYCKGGSAYLNHEVLLVGYGVDEDTGQKYWLIKNSWDTTWGINGFGKMAKDKNNQCGIASEAIYPII